MYQTEIERINEELYFIAASPVTRRVRMQAELLSQTDVPVLITGESGSGKTTVARLIHSLSIRSSYPFTQVKCGMLTADLLENELFGYEYKALNGRQEATPGKFEECGRGTVVLEEFEALSFSVQQRLLKMLETEEFCRVGGQQAIHAEVRIIATAVDDLQHATGERKILEELFYRLSVIELRVPSLRERADEIPLLLGHLMNRLSRRYGVPAPPFSNSLLEACQKYSWPGNLRELENFAKRFLSHGEEASALQELHSSFASSRETKVQDSGRGKPYLESESSLKIHYREQTTADIGLSRDVAGKSVEKMDERSPLKLLVRNAKGETERGAINDALQYTGWNRKAAARLLNVSYRALLYKIQEYGLAPAKAPVAQRTAQSISMRHAK